MNKQQWILSQSQTLNITNPNDLWSHLLTTLVEVENTDPRLNVLKLLTIEQAFAVVPDTEAFAISETRTYDRLLDAFRQGRMDWVQDNIKTLVAGGVMSLATAQALGVLMAQTEPDPNWKPTKLVPMYVVAGYYSLSLEDIVISLE